MIGSFKSVSLIILVILVLSVYRFKFKQESQKTLQIRLKHHSPSLLNNEPRKYKERTNFEIFFIESNMKRSEIDTKQMCAIESAAKNNPNALIKIFTLKSQLNKNSTFLLKKYDNIQFVDFNPEEFLNETNLLEFWNKGEVMRSKYGYAHLSDFLR